jgi:TolB-like protein
MVARWFVGVALTVAPALVQAQGSGPVVAVLPFENGGSYGRDKEDFDALKRGLAGTLMSELAASGSVQLVGREQVQKLIDGRGQSADKVDLAAAARVGKATGARFTVAATFIDLYGDFRIDAQIIDVTTGQVVTVVRSDPKLVDRGQLYRIVQSVADRVLEAINVTTPRNAGARARNIPTEALALYSRALLYQDRGDRQRAIDFYSQAVKSYPGYTEAQVGLRRLRGA